MSPVVFGCVRVFTLDRPTPFEQDDPFAREPTFVRTIVSLPVGVADELPFLRPPAVHAFARHGAPWPRSHDGDGYGPGDLATGLRLPLPAPRSMRAPRLHVRVPVPLGAGGDDVMNAVPAAAARPARRPPPSHGPFGPATARSPARPAGPVPVPAERRGSPPAPGDPRAPAPAGMAPAAAPFVPTPASNPGDARAAAATAAPELAHASRLAPVVTDDGGAPDTARPRAIPRMFQPPWEFDCSREEAISEMEATRIGGGGTLSALARRVRELGCERQSRREVDRWRERLSGRTLDEQLFGVRPPARAYTDPAIRAWARRSLAAAGYDVEPMLHEWEIFWRQKSV